MIDVVETMSLDDADVEELERNARQMLENRWRRTYEGIGCTMFMYLL
jgi:hypothetical protein